MELGARDLIAGYAAVVATAVMAWDIYKWRLEKKGVRIDGRAVSGMVAAGSAVTPVTAGKKYIAVRVANRGSLTCTVNILSLESYSSPLNRWRSKHNRAGFIADPISCRLPFKLVPGDEFMGMIEQTPEVEDWSRRETLYVAIHHSMSGKPYRMGITPIESKVGEGT
jgi:hypothetical protein